jgi:hypothetical protein
VEPEDELGSRIQARGTNLQRFAEKLGSTQKVQQIFPHPPPEDYLNIIVKVQAAGA